MPENIKKICNLNKFARFFTFPRTNLVIHYVTCFFFFCFYIFVKTVLTVWYEALGEGRGNISLFFYTDMPPTILSCHNSFNILI